MYHVYILQSLKDHKFYIGFTVDVERRLDEHNRGHNTSTSTRRPFRLIDYESHTNKIDALRREAYFKTTKGKSTFKQMLRTALTHSCGKGV